LRVEGEGLEPDVCGCNSGESENGGTRGVGVKEMKGREKKGFLIEG
jgi:hypothetical protein